MSSQPVRGPRWPRRQPASRGPADAGAVGQYRPKRNDSFYGAPPRGYSPASYPDYRQPQQQQAAYDWRPPYGGGYRGKTEDYGGRQSYGFPPAARPAKAASAEERPHKANGPPAPYKAYVCPGCQQHFDFCDRNNCYVGRVPLILECYHTVCQECVYRGVAKGQVRCPACGSASAVPAGRQDALQHLFPPNYHVVGLILWHKPRGGRGTQTDLRMVPAEAPPAGRRSTGRETEGEEEEEEEAAPPPAERCCLRQCDQVAELRCDECGEVYCEVCFSMMHGSVKALRHHEPRPLAGGDGLLLPQCPLHPSMTEVLCRRCDKKLCIYCYLDEHEGHEKTYLNRLNPEEKAELRKLRSNAERILKQFVTTQKKIECLSRYDPGAVEREACAAFAALHARLGAAEARVRAEAGGGGGPPARPESLAAAAAAAAAGAARVRRLLATDAAATAVNAKELVRALRELGDAPRFLVNVSGPPGPPVKFVSELAADGLERRFRVERGGDAEYVLVAEDQLPDGYERDAEAAAAAPEGGAGGDARPSTDDDRASSATTASTADESRFALVEVPGKAKRKKKHELDNERVIVTYIRSMDSVYVQTKKARARLQRLAADVEAYAAAAEGAPPPARPRPNDVYLALYETRAQREWCRGRVLAARAADGDDARCDVLFVDFGHEQTVGAERLRELPAALALARTPPLAREVRVAAPAGARWARHAHLELGRLVHGRELVARVLPEAAAEGVAGGAAAAPPPRVDLLIASDDGRPTSVADLLLYAYDGLSAPAAAEGGGGERASTGARVFPNGARLTKGRCERASVAHVVDPHNLFVHLASCADAFDRMRQQMRRHYRHAAAAAAARASEDDEDAEPPAAAGAYVAADLREGDPRGRWQRALVVDAGAGAARRAHLLLVDWGARVTVPWAAVRPLREQFARLDAQAVAVRLAHVEPPTGAVAWPPAAADLLAPYARSREQLRLLVAEAGGATGPPRVALFDCADAAVDVCLNAKLAATGLARAVGPLARSVEWPRGSLGEGGDGGGDAAAPDGGLVDELLRRIHGEPSGGPPEEYEDDEAEKAFKRRVEVVRVDDPGRVVVRFRLDGAPSERLFREMEVHYTEAEARAPPAGPPRPGDWCAARCRHGYRRARVLAPAGDGHRVYLPDYGEEADVGAGDVFVLDDYFRAFPQEVHTCHLARVRPAGDTGRWSASAADALRRLLTAAGAEVHLTAVGECEERAGGPGGAAYKSVPARMWYRPAVGADAFEDGGAAAARYASVEGALVRLGYAYRARDGAKEGPATPTETAPAEAPPADEASWPEMVDRESPLPEGAGAPPEAPPPEAEAAAAPASPYKTREVALSDWLPPFRLERREFVAVVTCAETGGGLFLHDEQLDPVYRNMEARLSSYFGGDGGGRRRPDGRRRWEAGRMCTVAWEGGWYRARVLGPGRRDPAASVAVLMVDFGSDHEVPARDLSEEILFPDVPPFATKAKLDEVTPLSGAWLASDYDLLLDVLKEAGPKLRVLVRGPLDVDEPRVRVALPDGADLAQRLVELSPNLVGRRAAPGPPPLPDDDDDDDDAPLLVTSDEDDGRADDDGKDGAPTGDASSD